jgi:hypothetical protein
MSVPVRQMRRSEANSALFMAWIRYGVQHGASA